MADSDEEHDKSRSRDKFRRERSDYGGEKSRSRGDHREKRGWREDHEPSRRRSRDEYEGDRDRRRYSSPHGHRGREWSPPPPKRMRREGWDSYHDFPGMMGPYGMRPQWILPGMPPHGPHQLPPGPGGLLGESPVGTPQGSKKQAMMSFKQFLAQQEDSIDEMDAIQKYNEYKREFKGKQVKEFFEEHKEEDWLIEMYHPKRVSAQEEAAAANLQSRVKAFLFLLESGRLDKVPLGCDKPEDIITVMDTAVIKMEGGTDHDLLSLEIPATGRDEDMKGENKDEGKQTEDSEGKPSFMILEPTEEQRQLAEQARSYGKQMVALQSGEEEKSPPTPLQDETAEEAPKKKKKTKKPRDLYSFSEGAESEESSSEEEEGKGDQEKDGQLAEIDEPPPPGMESDPPLQASDEPLPPGANGVTTNGDLPQGAVPETGQTEPVEQKDGEKAAAEDNTTPARSLHLTRSIYIRHIPPKISAEDIVEVCRTIPGYLRIAFADPAPDRGYERRGWVTYSNETDIRDASARLIAAKLRDNIWEEAYERGCRNIKECQLNCMVNRELSRRVKHSPGVAWAHKAVQSDVGLVLQLIRALDKKNNLWEHAQLKAVSGGDVETEDTELQSNPVLAIPDSLLQEEPVVAMVTGGEEEEGVISDPGTEIMSNQDEKVKVMDRLIWYLRIVHSVDYYSVTAFPSEDRMPHRCGIITTRGQKPNAVTQEEVAEYVGNMESRVKPLLEAKKELSEDEMEKYGKKDLEAEAERFVELNTQKLSEHKYLCPLSGKKFKGPEFVRKHIFNKHMEKVEEARQEAWFFNNYLRDADRPMPLEATLSSSSALQTPGQTPGGGSGAEESPAGPGGVTPPAWGQGGPIMVFGRGGFSPGMGGFPPGMMGRGGFRPPRGGRRGRGRRVINYHDLDAPEEMY